MALIFHTQINWQADAIFWLIVIVVTFISDYLERLIQPPIIRYFIGHGREPQLTAQLVEKYVWYGFYFILTIAFFWLYNLTHTNQIDQLASLGFAIGLGILVVNSLYVDLHRTE